MEDRVDGSSRGSVYLTGSGSISSPITSSVTWPSPVQRLILNDDVEVAVQTSLTVSKLGGDGTGALTVESNTLTINGMDNDVLGSRCTIEIQEGATLDTTAVTNFKVTSNEASTSLDIYGTMNAAKVSMEANGISFMII